LYKMKDVWLQIVQNGMAKNFSWAQQAKEYVSLYEETRRV